MITSVTPPIIARLTTPAAVSSISDTVFSYILHDQLGEYGFCGDGYVSPTRFHFNMPC